jgi:hypothetical protein
MGVITAVLLRTPPPFTQHTRTLLLKAVVVTVVQRRYRDFVAFRERLEAVFPKVSLPPLPGKKVCWHMVAGCRLLLV